MNEAKMQGGKCRSDYEDYEHSMYNGALFSGSLPFNNKEAADLAKAESDKKLCEKLDNSEAYIADYNTYAKPAKDETSGTKTVK